MNNLQWFNNLNDDEKNYINKHPDPSHIVKYLKKGYSFYNALLNGYIDHIKEDNEIKDNEDLAFQNKLNNNLI